MTCPDCRDRGVLPNGTPCLACENEAFTNEPLGGDASTGTP